MPAAVVMAGATLAGGAMAANASKKAAKTQAKSADKASAIELKMFNQSRKDQEPWRKRGELGLNKISVGLGLSGSPKDPFYGSLNRQFGASDLGADPIYQERLRVGLPEGQNNIMGMMSSRGGLESGATMKALARFNQDYAGGEGANAFNRFQVNRSNILNPLQSLSGTGQTSAAQIGNQGSQVARSIGENTMGAGNARASGYVGGANAINSAIGQGVNAYQQNQLMKNMQFDNSYGNFLTSNSGVMNQGLTPNDLYRGF